MRRKLAALLLVVVSTSGGQPPAKPPYAADKPLDEPTLFVEGSICTGEYESHPALTPDGRTLYFVKSTPDFAFWTIVVSRWQNGKWSAPEVAPFSGRYADADPFITPDGANLYFISNRPVPGRAEPDLDIWVMDRNGDSWSEPRNLGAPVNSERNEWFPTLADNGTIYFGSERPGGSGRCDVYRARREDREYRTAENLGESINTPAAEFEPLIARDESWLIFAALGRAEGKGQFDLFVSYNRDGAWTKAANLGEKINTAATEFSPALSPDGAYLFFTSTRSFSTQPLDKRLSTDELRRRLNTPRNGLGDLYQVDLGAVGLEP